MIDLYYYHTPNGHKITIFCEETGLPYRIIPVDITKGEQFKPEFLKINPNNMIPAIIDQDGPGGKPYSLFESGAILLYLAEKTGKLMPVDMRARYDVIAWLMLQMARIGPFLGQAAHFRLRAKEKIPYAIDYFTAETHRLCTVLDRRLGETPYVAGDYSIADIATFPWLRIYDRVGQKLEDFPNLKRWYEAIDARPAVQRGLAVTANVAAPAPSA